MKNSDYWKMRFVQLEEAQNRKGAAAYHEIEEQYRIAQQELEGNIRAWYQRFANNNGISMAEARKMLFGADLKELKWDVREYIKRGKENAINQKWMKELENASARFHISRLEALKLQTQQSLELMFGNQLDCIDSTMKRIYLDGYYHTAYELQKGFHIGFDVAGIDPSQVEKVIGKPWAVDGKNFSERIWGNKEKLIAEVHKNLTQNILLGQDPQKAIDAIAKKMKTSKYNAGRLVMTEEAYFSSVAQKDCFQELDVEQYKILATLDSHTSTICQNMDGKVFSIKDFESGVTAPPFHVYCRSTTIPYFEDNFGQIGERAARGENGKTYYVPANMTYKEWEKSFVEGDKSGWKETKLDKSGEDVIAEYTASRKEYEEQVQKLAELENEMYHTLDAYMNVRDTPQAVEYKAMFDDKFQKIESLKQVVKDLKAVLLGKEARAVRQIEKNLAVETGIPVDRIDLTRLQYETANMIYLSYKTVLCKYPELKGQLEALEYGGVSNRAYASNRQFTGEIKIYDIFTNFDKLVKSYANDVAAGFHPVGTDHNGIIIHELGHVLDGYMTKQKLLDADYNQYEILQTTSKTVKDMTLKFLGFDKQEINIELKSQGLTLPEKCDILEQIEKDFIIQHVSRYAAKNEKEFFAECFVEYVMSDKPRKAAQIFGEIIDKILGR